MPHKIIQCQFVLKAWAAGSGKQVGIAEVDMAPFIGKSDGKIRLQMQKCEFPNVFIDCEFKVTETSDSRNEDDFSGDEDAKSDVSPNKGGDTTPTAKGAADTR